MIDYFFNKTLAMLFFMACFGALMNPPPYISIGIIFLLMGLIILPETSIITERKFKWKINTRFKTYSVLLGFILVCLVVPQVNLDTTPFSSKYLEPSRNISKI